MNDIWWRDRAVCVGKDPTLWEIPHGHGKVNRTQSRRHTARIEKAKAYCRSCPVIAECLIEAMKIDSMMLKVHGSGKQLTSETIMAGLTPRERKKLRQST